jgi:phenylpropionate dioxygenase-like ring-hydroxylating dioxygenase large terminal subunit
MEKTEQIRLLRQLMQRLDSGTTVDAGGLREIPTSVYTCKELAQREREVFFHDTPQLIGMSADLPERGSFVTLNDFSVPILATRDETGAFNAYLNVCRHRGVVLENEARGDRSRFTCPFHAWTYSNNGDLVGIPKEGHFGKIDKSCHGLIPLPAVERYGFLWVHPDPDGTINVDTLLGGLAEEFESWGWGSLVNIGYDSYDMRLNWKLAMDTFGETYHFNTLHRDSLALSFYGNVQCYDVFGRNHRMILCMRSIDELREQPEENWHINSGSLPVYYLFPNIQVNVLPFGIALVRAYPDSLDVARSISQISFYARAEALEARSEEIKTIMENFAGIIRDEDYAVASRSQTGADSGLLKSIVFGRNEPALHHYHNTYRTALDLEPYPLIED